MLFVGDSLIEFFDWQTYFPDKKVWNYGRAAETVEGLLSRMGTIIEQTCPDWILIMSGTNNIGMDDYGFMPNYEKIIDNFSKQFSKAEIVVNSLLPFSLPWTPASAIEQVNTLFAKMADDKKISFLDIYSLFLDHGRPNLKCFQDDGVHLTETGYAIWADAVKKQLMYK